MKLERNKKWPGAQRDSSKYKGTKEKKEIYGY
jgi:hypothetical protein